MKRLGVLEYENAKLETLSKGNQQKVQLASTLVCDPDIVILDEPFSGLDPVNSRILQDVVMELAHQKAENVYGKITDLNDYTVIGSDTIVVYRDEILGKPVDKQEAYDMLSMLADRTHQVYTGVSLIQKKNGEKKTKTFFVQTDVTLYPIDKEDLHRYVESKDPMDKAGAYGVQEWIGFIGVENISGLSLIHI